MRHHVPDGTFVANSLVGAAWPFSSAVVWFGQKSSGPARMATWRAFEVAWVHMSPLTIMQEIERDRFKYSKRSFFAVVGKHCNR
jgi:hypothetical protein